MSTKVYFDMDGTVFDLYGKDNWLELLQEEKAGAFTGDFLPEIDTKKFYSICQKLLEKGVQFGIITWLPMQASPEYEQICTEEKRTWAGKNLPFITEFNCVSYGIPKQNCIQKRTKKMFLIDDNMEVCKTWATAKQRTAINVNETFTVVNALEQILENM